MNRIEITTPKYTLPEFAYDLLVVETDKSQTTSIAGQVKEVEVPNGGVSIHYRSSGGKPMQPSQFVTYKRPEPPPPPTPTITVPKLPPLTPKVEPTDTIPLLTPPAPLPPPPSAKINITDSASATVEPKVKAEE